MAKKNFDVFISYSRKDMKVVKGICSALSEAGLTYFIDLKGIEGGQNFPQVIADAINRSTVFLFLASPNSYQSKFSRAEVTYAFNHKSSGTIIPYIIDGSVNMPHDLELMLGNLNWRHIEQCPPSSILIEDIKLAIANPEDVSVGGFTNHSHQNKNHLLWVISCFVVLLLIAVVLLSVSGSKTKRLKNEAVSRAAIYERYIDNAESLVKQADVMMSSPNTLETTDMQSTCLKRAIAELDSSDQVRNQYLGSEYITLFNKDEKVGQLRKVITMKLDSMFISWKNYAMESFDLYKITHNQSESRNAVECINHALFIKASPELETLKNNLNQQ